MARGHEGGCNQEEGPVTTTLNTYIFKKTLAMCMGAALVLWLVVLVSIFLGNIGTFMEKDTPAGVILAFLACSSPQILYWVLPFSVCVGVVAAQASFSRNLETIAMQASGVTFARMAVPYLAVGGLFVVLMAALSFELYPLSQREARKIEQIQVRKRGVEGSFTVNGGRFKVGDDIYLVRYVDVVRGIMMDVICYHVVKGRIESVMHADSVFWDKGAWRSPGMETVRITQDGMEVSRGERALPLVHAPRDLVVAQPSPDVLTLRELFAYRASLGARSIRSVGLDTQMHARISFSVAPFIMTLLVLPFGLRFPRAGGIARGIAVGVFLGLAYWSLRSGLTGAGTAGYLHPVLAAWGADVAAAIAAFSLVRYRRMTYA